MLELDGSFGSGGGQILRTALSLSALTGKPFAIKNIRSNRPKPGLQLQHLACVKALAQLCSAKTRGAKKGSIFLEFTPKEFAGGQLVMNIGSAGSISLLLQSLLLPSAFKETRVRAFGGTDVRWAPSAEFCSLELFPILQKMNAKFDLTLHSRGYFPNPGNGSASFKSIPSKSLNPLVLHELGDMTHFKLVSHCSNLPKEVALNQLRAAKKILLQEFKEAEFEEAVECREQAETTGSGIDCFAFFSSGTVLGANALGEKGKPALQVGGEAARLLVQQISRRKPVDIHLADQLIPFMAAAKGFSSIECAMLSEHCLTNISVTEKILEVKFRLEGKLNESARIEVHGAGFSLKED